MVALARVKASPEAVARRRANRAARRVWERREPPTRHLPQVAKSGLTPHEQRILHIATRPLFEQGTIDLRFMGIRFLELFHLSWTPLRYVVIGGKAEMRGVWCTDVEFEDVWAWWCGLHGATRILLLTSSV